MDRGYECEKGPLDFDDWSEESLEEYWKMIQKNAAVARNTYDQMGARMNYLLMVNGVMLALIIRAMVAMDSNIILGALLISSSAALIISTILATYGIFFVGHLDELYRYKEEDILSCKNSPLSMKKVIVNRGIATIEDYSEVNTRKHLVMTLAGAVFIVGVFFLVFAIIALVFI